MKLKTKVIESAACVLVLWRVLCRRRPLQQEQARLSSSAQMRFSTKHKHFNAQTNCTSAERP